MAKQRLVSNTRIYRDCRMLLDEVLDISVNFPRAHKFTIGSKMQEYAVDILNELAGAYVNKSLAVRIDHLTRFQVKFETIKSLIRVSGERRSPLSFWDYLPKDKSLFTNGEGKGVAIGNLFAQHFANFLLNELDWFIEELGITHHGRYVDDFYMIHEDKEVLLSAIPEIRKMLSGIGISLNEKKFYLQHYAKGVKFTGAIVKPYRTYCGKRTVSNFKQAVENLNRSMTIEEVRKHVCSINSYLGLLRQHDEYNNRRKILGSIDRRMFKYVYIKGHHEVLALKRKYKTWN